MTKKRIARLENDVKMQGAAIKMLLVALEKTSTEWVVKHELRKILKAWMEMEKEDVGKKDG